MQMLEERGEEQRCHIIITEKVLGHLDMSAIHERRKLGPVRKSLGLTSTVHDETEPFLIRISEPRCQWPDCAACSNVGLGPVLRPSATPTSPTGNGSTSLIRILRKRESDSMAPEERHVYQERDTWIQKAAVTATITDLLG